MVCITDIIWCSSQPFLHAKWPHGYNMEHMRPHVVPNINISVYPLYAYTHAHKHTETPEKHVACRTIIFLVYLFFVCVCAVYLASLRVFR